MASVVRARTKLHSLSAVVDDPSFDTYWQLADTTTGSLAAVTTAIELFLNGLAAGQAVAMKDYISTVIDRSANATEIEYYDITTHLAGTPAGSPIDILTFTLAAASSGGQTLPEGCAATLEYRADYGTDVEFGPGTRPRARDRNRFYLGPLKDTAVGLEALTNRCVWTAQFITDILSAAATLQTPFSGTTGAVVWSRKNAAVKFPVAQQLLDDHPTYQRRRVDPGVKHHS